MAQTPAWTQFPNSPAGTSRNDDIYFSDLTNGWSARGTDGVYRTSNAGQSWTKVFTNGVTATVAADGKITAQRLQVTKDGVRPPQ